MISVNLENTEQFVREPVAAVERRAAAEEWDPHYRKARSRMAEVLKICRRHYMAVAPQHAGILVRSVRLQMIQAVSDCRDLDRLSVERDLEPIYMEAFTVFKSQEALFGMHCRAMAELQSLFEKQKSPMDGESELDADKLRWRFTLERIREGLRDGRDIGFVLQLHSESIKSWAEKGQEGFFDGLGDLIRKHRKDPLTRSLAGWIARAWLPLCLWECCTSEEKADKAEAHRRFCQAARLMKLEHLRVDSSEFFHQFVDAWRNFRNRKLKLQAPILVKSAG